MRKFISITLVIVLVLGLSVFVLAHGSFNENRGYRQDDYYNQLNLSEQQIHDLEELEEEYYDKVDDLRDEIWDKQDDLRDAYVDKDSKEGNIVKLQEQVNKLRQDLFAINQEYQLKLRKMLTNRQLDYIGRYGMKGMGFYNCGIGGYGHGPRGNMNYGPGMMHQGPRYNGGHHGPGMMNGF